MERLVTLMPAILEQLEKHEKKMIRVCYYIPSAIYVAPIGRYSCGIK